MTRLASETSLSAVNVMEEVISDDEGATAKSNRKSSKHTKTDKRKRGLQYPEG